MFQHPQNYDRSADDVHLSGYTAPNYGQSGPGLENGSGAQNRGGNTNQSTSAQPQSGASTIQNQN